MLKKKKWAKLSLGILLFLVIIIYTVNLFACRFVFNHCGESEYGLRPETTISLSRIITGLKKFKRICGRFPNQKEGLSALLQKPIGLKCKLYPKDGFLEAGEANSLKDGWGNDFLYKYNNNGSPDIMSLGPDGELGTPDDIHYPRRSKD